MKKSILKIGLLVVIVLALLAIGAVACSSSSPTTSVASTTPPPSSMPPTAATTTPPMTSMPPTTTTTTPPMTTTTPATTPSQTVTIDIVAKNIAFDKSTITVPAGAKVIVNFNNQDSGIPHNVSFYTDSSASTAIFVGQIITGPKTVTYTFTAPSTPGKYFFRCDVHPTVMVGTFIVQ
jgi:plastocyanin